MTDTTPATSTTPMAPKAMLVAVPAQSSSSAVPVAPPATPNTLGLKRAGQGILVALPFLLTYVVDPLIEAWGNVTLPDEYKPFAPILSGIFIAYASWRKRQKEVERAKAANTLTALGVPIGVPMDASDARKVTS